MPPPAPVWWESTGLMPAREATPFNAGGPRDYVRRYRVILNHRLHDPYMACIAPYIPRPYSMYITEYGYDELALCIHISAKHIEDAEMQAHYEVTCKWSTEIPNQGIPENFGFPSQGQSQSNGPQNNPELEPPDISWDYEELKLNRQTDLDGKPFVNSALMPYSPPPMIEGCRAILVYTRNDRSFDGVRAASYANTYNTKTIAGRHPGTLLNLAPKAVIKWKGGIQYARVTYRIKFGMEIGKSTYTNPDTGQVRTDPVHESFMFHKELDQGFCELFPRMNDAGTEQLFELVPKPGVPGQLIKNYLYKWSNIKDTKHQPVHKPVLLDGHGRQMPKIHDANGVPQLQEAVYNAFSTRRGVDFNDFITRGF